MTPNRRRGNTCVDGGLGSRAALACLGLVVATFPAAAQEPVRSWRHVTASEETHLAWSPPLLGFGLRDNSAVDDDGSVISLSRAVTGDAFGWARIDRWQPDGDVVSFFEPGRFGSSVSVAGPRTAFHSERTLFEVHATPGGWERSQRVFDDRDTPFFTTPLPGGDLFVGGQSRTDEAFLSRYAEDGTRRWRSTYPGTVEESQGNWFDGLAHPDGDTFAVGATWIGEGDDVSIVTAMTRIAADGTERWLRVLPASDYSASFRLAFPDAAGSPDDQICAAGLFTGFTERVFCLDAVDGTPSWQSTAALPSSLPLPTGSQLHAQGGRLVHLLSTYDRILLSSRRSADGQVLWTQTRERYLGSFVVRSSGELVAAATSPEGCITLETFGIDGTSLDVETNCPEQGVWGAQKLYQTPDGALRLFAQSAPTFDDLLVTLYRSGESQRGVARSANRSLLLELDSAGAVSTVRELGFDLGSGPCAHPQECLVPGTDGRHWSGTAWALDGSRAAVGAVLLDAAGQATSIRPAVAVLENQGLRAIASHPDAGVTLVFSATTPGFETTQATVVHYDHTGHEVWRDAQVSDWWQHAEWSPGGELFLAAFEALEKRSADGVQVWRTTMDSTPSIAVHPDSSVSGVSSSWTGLSVGRLNGADGSLRWSAELTGFAGASLPRPQVESGLEDTLVWSPAPRSPETGATQLALLQRDDGSEVWRAGFAQMPQAGETTTLQRIVAVPESARFFALGSAGRSHAPSPVLELRSLEAGALIWRRDLVLPPVSSNRGLPQPGVILDGALDPERSVLWLVGQRTSNGTPHDDGFVARVDAETGDLLWLEIVAGTAGMDDALTEVVVDPITGAAVATGYEGQTNNFPQQITLRWELPGSARLEAEKTASGSFSPGGFVRYRIVVRNPGFGTDDDVVDGSGPELVDQLPPELELVEATATSGTIDLDLVSHRVEWNGALAAGQEVWVTIDAQIRDDVAIGTTISNQAQLTYDSNGDGTNDGAALSMDPDGGGATTLGVATPIPLARSWQLGLIAGLLLTGLAVIRRGAP